MGVAVVREEQCSARLYDEGGSQQGCRRLCTQPRSCSKGILEAEGEFHCNIVGVVGESQTAWYPGIFITDLGPRSVGTLDHGYVRNVPLPRAPLRQSPVQVTCNMQVSHDNPITSYSEVPRIPMWRDLSRSLFSLSRTMILPFAPVWLM